MTLPAALRSPAVRLPGAPRARVRTRVCVGALVAAVLTIGLAGGAAAEPARGRFAGAVVSGRAGALGSRVVALTFDDGPSADITPRVLRELARHGARATFFVLGEQAVRRPDLLRRIALAGHEIGVHGWTHSARLPRARASVEIDRTAELIERATGRTPVLLRPPYGIRNSALAIEARRRGMTVVLWSISSADTTHAPPRTLADNVIHTPNPGDIALMHDGAGHRTTAEALPAILNELSARGWRFVTVSDLLARWAQRSSASGRRARQLASRHPRDGDVVRHQVHPARKVGVR